MTRLIALLLLAACTAAPPPRTPAPAAAALLPALEAELRELIRGYAADTAEVAVAFKDLASGDSLLIDAHATMHAASTMKVPVMLELFRRAEAGELSLDEPIPVRNEFRSIADGSSYSLSVGDDSEHGLYGQLGEQVPLRRLMELMITHSSNLATNLLIDLADADRIAGTLARIGASEMRVLRGVEDNAAYERGLNNTTTAYGFMKVLEGVASGSVVSPQATEEMINILEGQEFQEMIPAGLPPGTRVGNKTGWITRIQHDGAVVYPPNRPPYVLVVLTRGFTDRERAAELGREISRRVYRAVMEE